jgi:hypothetical protein
MRERKSRFLGGEEGGAAKSDRSKIIFSFREPIGEPAQRTFVRAAEHPSRTHKRRVIPARQEKWRFVMRTSYASSIKFSLVAATLALGLAAAATPASAHMPHPGGGGGHPGGFGPHGHWGHGGWGHGGWGPGFGFGVGIGVVDTGYAYDDCIRYRPIYDVYGNYVGQRAVNVCD